MYYKKDFFTMKDGFTLVEILVVVTIIALVATIAVPNFLRTRLNANETAAISAIRTLSTSLQGFRSTSPSFPVLLNELGSSLIGGTDPAYIDDSLAQAIDVANARRGYFFTYVLINANQYSLNADPADPRVTGVRGFYVDETGVIRGEDPAPATVASTPIQ